LHCLRNITLRSIYRLQELWKDHSTCEASSTLLYCGDLNFATISKENLLDHQEITRRCSSAVRTN